MSQDGDGYLSIHDFRPFCVDSLMRVICWDVDIQRISMADIFTQLIDSTFPQHHTTADRRTDGAIASADDTVGCSRFSLHNLRRSPFFPHLVKAFINIFQFIVDDTSGGVSNGGPDRPGPTSVWHLYIEEALLAFDDSF